MASQDDAAPKTSSSVAFPWILEHILAYPGSYEIPLRTMYTLNCATSTQQPTTPPPTGVPGNAFPRSTRTAPEEQYHLATTTAAAQLKANLLQHLSQLPMQPTSLPPAFVTSFVRKCFPSDLTQVDFPQALTAMDYLKDLEIRRRAEIVAAMTKLGIDRTDLVDREQMTKKYPGVVMWFQSVEEKEKKVEAIYSQVYVGLRRWTLVNEMSLVPFNKANCIAMLNTLYPPITMSSSHFVPPTAQLTAGILTEQRNAFFRYITAVERKGVSVLSSLMLQHKRPGEDNGWSSLRDSVDSYLRLVNNIIDECNEITGRGSNQSAASSTENLEEHRRKVDSGISFGSGRSSNRSSAHSHATRPSTSSSTSTHSRQVSKEKQLPEKPLPSPGVESQPPSPKAAGTTLERIAREVRRIRSKSNVRDDSKARPTTAYITREEQSPTDVEPFQLGPAPAKGLRFMRSLKKMRSNTGLRERTESTSRPTSRAEDNSPDEVPAFDAEEMKIQRQAWEASQPVRGGH